MAFLVLGDYVERHCHDLVLVVRDKLRVEIVIGGNFHSHSIILDEHLAQVFV